ncbi:actin-like protein ARPC3 [Trametes punicea]|nr:actin-like protein ARPC3 [Trametes punicea]
MPAYHSSFNEYPDTRLVGNLAILPIKTKFRGPAPVADPNDADIIDETLDLFRANSLFRNFEIKGPADRLLIILILFVSDCLAKIGSARTTPNQIEANKMLNTLAVDNFPIPGDATFPLNAHYAPPPVEQMLVSTIAILMRIRDGISVLTLSTEYLRGYLTQVRQELAARLVEKLYADGTGKPSKWWMSFQKRRFMNRSLGTQ